MKKAFAVASLAVWTLAILVGVGLAVVGQVNATNRLPVENLVLLQKVSSLEQDVSSLRIAQRDLQETLAVERTRQKQLNQGLRIAYSRMLPEP